MDWNHINITLVISITMLFVMCLRSGFKDPLVMVSLFYFYFTFGPVINIIIGNEIYFGIIKENIAESTTIFTLALGGLFTGSFIKLKTPSNENLARVAQTRYFGLYFVLIPVILYTLFVLATVGIPALSTSNKLLKISLLLSPSLHYNYLLLQIYIMSFYFLVRQHKDLRRIYILNAMLYLAYCLIFDERDFIFIFVSIFLHTGGFNVNPQKPRRLRFIVILALICLVFAIYATLSFTVRVDYGHGFVGGFLNQGSILFVNTQIINYVNWDNFLHGETYINSLYNLVPSSIYRTDFVLASWFKNLYAPGGDSGYGFALDAEAFLNFGYWGIFPLFFMIAVISRKIFNSSERNPFSLYLSVFFTAQIMYAFRNDSLSLFKSTFYAHIFFVIIVLVSLPAMKVSNNHESHHRPRTALPNDAG